MWYKLEYQYNMWEFIKLLEKQKEKLIKNVKENYYDKQPYDYIFRYFW